jgi:phytoene desaturase
MKSMKVVIIGSGFAGLSAASFMAKEGWQVTVIEKHSTPGGRARQLNENGFSFDMGPSWYWMPDVFERYFQQFGKNVSDYYTLQRLDPSYRVYWNDSVTDVPASYEELKKLFESIEPGAGHKLDLFLKEAAYKYSVGINKLVYKPGLSLTEFIDWEVISGVFRLDIFSSIKKHIGQYFSHYKLRQLMEFPVLFLGALPENTPALYSLMNYADMVGGTWYPNGGMYSVVQGMYKLAIELGVEFVFNETVEQIVTDRNAARTVRTDKNEYAADAVIGGADYHFIENKLLAAEHRSYSDAYWDKKLMAPSCLLYYVGLNKRLSNIRHHMLFFDVPFEQHAKEIYTTPSWPANPLFYVSASSVTDGTVAPEGHENLFFLVPVAAGLTGDTEELRNQYFEQLLTRFEARIGEPIRDSIVYKRTFAYSDFVQEYNSFKGNAYGLANTLMQTAIFRPSCRSKKIKNLFYAGQLTVPGPGVPPSLISGEVAAKEVVKRLQNNKISRP